MRSNHQEIGMSALFIMTVWNCTLAILMIVEFIPVFHGLIIAFVGMCAIIYVSWRMLMGDERPWESRKRYLERKNNELP